MNYLSIIIYPRRSWDSERTILLDARWKKEACSRGAGSAIFYARVWFIATTSEIDIAKGLRGANRWLQGNLTRRRQRPMPRWSSRQRKRFR